MSQHESKHSSTFKVGDEVRTHDTVPREGRVHAVLATNEYQVCFDAANKHCSVYKADQLTLVKAG